MDHYEVRGWHCLHRHFCITQLTHLFYAPACGRSSTNRTMHDDPLEHLTTEQVRRAMNAWLEAAQRLTKVERLQRELAKQNYYRCRKCPGRRNPTRKRAQPTCNLWALIPTVSKLAFPQRQINRIYSSIQDFCHAKRKTGAVQLGPRGHPSWRKSRLGMARTIRFHLDENSHHGILYCRQQTRSLGEIIRGLILVWEVYDAEELVNKVEYLT